MVSHALPHSFPSDRWEHGIRSHHFLRPCPEILIPFANPGPKTTNETSPPDVSTTETLPRTLDETQLGETEDPFAGLLNFTSSEQETDDIVRGWLTGSGYDL
jgi:hypothetical protein